MIAGILHPEEAWYFVEGAEFLSEEQEVHINDQQQSAHFIPGMLIPAANKQAARC